LANVPIVPDTKDWTCVLARTCPECGFDSTGIAPDDVPELIRKNAAGWRAVMQQPALAERPADDRWSKLEYACHVRDVFRLYDYRLHLMLDEDDPHYPDWDQDVTAIEEGYNEQDPAVVASELQAAADQIANSFEQVHGNQWQRTGKRSDGARFTVESFARYFIHDPIHHLHDVDG
jgi:hypothetical protein